MSKLEELIKKVCKILLTVGIITAVIAALYFMYRYFMQDDFDENEEDYDDDFDDDFFDDEEQELKNYAVESLRAFYCIIVQGKRTEAAG